MTSKLKTTICIIGAGPAGIVLGNMLLDHQIDCMIIDRFSRSDIFERGRAGTLEHRTIETLKEHGLADSILANGMLSTVCEFRSVSASQAVEPVMPKPGSGKTDPATPAGSTDSDADCLEFDYAKHSGTEGRYIYPQSRLNDELIERFLGKGGTLLFEHDAVAVNQSTRQVKVSVKRGDEAEPVTIDAKFVVGCDGFHGVTRKSVDPTALTTYEKEYDYQWLTLIAEAAPIRRRVIYGIHPDGFVGHIPRTESMTRYYLQIPASDSAHDWPDTKAWAAIETRLATGSIPRGSFSSKATMTLRSFVAEPLRFERIFLAGDAAHIVSPLGGKGMNMAIADAAELAATLATYFKSKKPLRYLDRYSEVRLPQIWQSEEFSTSMLELTHSLSDSSGRAFAHKLNQAKLHQLKAGGPFATHFARQFVGVVGPG